MMDSRRSLVALSCVLSAALLSACQADGPSPEEVRRGGTVVIGAGSDLDHANPLVSVDAWTNEVLRYVLFTPLVRYGPDLTLEPALAERWEMLGDSGVVFHLRRDVSWHDGTPTTAYDVLFTFERARDPATGFPNTDYFGAWTGGEVVDSFTVRFHFEPHLEPLAGLPFIPPVPAHLLDTIPAGSMRQAAFNRSPVGNGPFRFVSHRPGDRWVFERNPDHPEGIGGAPPLDRLVWRVIPENSAQITELRVGNVDLSLQPRPDQAEALSDRAGIRAVVKPSRHFSMVAWNGLREPLDDPRVRKALTLAMDRPAILEGLRRGYGEPAVGPVMPFHWAYDHTLEPIPHDPRAALALLEESGIRDRDGDGTLELSDGSAFELEIKVPAGSESSRDMAEAIRDDLAGIGVRASSRPTEATTLFADLTSPERRFDAALIGWSSDVRLDLRDTFHSAALSGPYQFASYANPRVDSLMERAAAALDRETATRLWGEIQTALREEQPWTPIYYQTDVFLARDRVRNLDMDLRGALVNAHRWWVEPPEAPEAGAPEAN